MRREPAYDIDLAKLEETYKRKQFEVHPDRFSNASRVEQDAAVDHSSRLNKCASSLVLAHFSVIDPSQWRIQGIPCSAEPAITRGALAGDTGLRCF